MEKLPIFLPKPCTNPFEKSQFLTSWTSGFYSLEKRFFFLEYRKRHFPGLYCLKKDGKMANFWPKPWVWKNANFSTFWTWCFYSPERRFFFLEYPITHFLASFAKNKKMEKFQILEQIHGLTPLEKCQFLNFLKFLVVPLRRCETHFLVLLCLK